ncbi:MAG: hypothetical protein ABIF10_03975 [Candidatus Woesearchaeota archaeon]
MKFAVVVLFLLLCAGCERRIEVFPVPDKCGPIYGNVFHSIKDNSTCRIVCRSTCESLEKEFVSSLFIDNGLRCHECNCSCAQD